MLDRDSIIAMMESAIGGSTASTGHSLIATLNWAGREIFGARDWPWKTSAQASAAAVADSGVVALPSDFMNLLSITTTDEELVQLVTMEEIDRMRRTGATDSTGWKVAINSWKTQATTADQPTPQLEVYPTPTGTSVPTFTVRYGKRWVPLASGTAVPNMPDEMEEALVELARAKAWSIENYPDKADYSLYEAALAKAWDLFRGQQRSFGQITGGAASRTGPSWIGENPSVSVTL